MLLFCRIQKLSSINRDQIFIGRHDMLSGMQRIQDISFRRFDPAHHFDHDPDLIVIQNLIPVIRQEAFVNSRSLFPKAVYQDLFQFQLGAHSLLHDVGTSFKQFVYAGSDCSCSQKCCFDLLSHILFLLFLFIASYASYPTIHLASCATNIFHTIY